MSDGDIRLFVALELPAPVRRVLIEWRETVLAHVGGLRALPEASLHVTLCFLGWWPEHELAPIRDACGVLRGAAAPELALGEGLWLPRRRPRVLAVSLEDPTGALSRAQSTLSTALAAGGWYEAEDRPYLAHVTVARVNRGARVRASELPPPASQGFHGVRTVLYRSRLSRGGAQYEALSTVELAD